MLVHFSILFSTKSFENDGSLESFFKAINYGEIYKRIALIHDLCNSCNNIGNVRAVQEMIGNRDVNAVDDRGVGGLHIAAIKGDS